MAAERLYRKPGLLAVHPMTALNGFHFAAGVTRSDTTRRLMLLQAAAWLAMFRDELRRRVDLSMTTPGLDTLVAADTASAGGVLDIAAENPHRAAGMALAVARSPRETETFLRESRALILRKGDGSHHYKFGVAIIEEHAAASPRWAPHLLASSLSYLPTRANPDTAVYQQARRVLQAL